MTVASWFISPLLSSFLAGLIFLLICSTTLGGHVNNPALKMTFLTLIFGISNAFTAYMVIGLAANNATALLFETAIPIAFLFGIF